MADHNHNQQQHLLLSGGSRQYQKLYLRAIEAMKSHIFFRPMTKDGRHVLFPGDVMWDDDQPTIEAKAQHLSCFAGGMAALGARVFERPEDEIVARRLVDGCIWGYENGLLGIMPEIIRLVACEDEQDGCPWDEEKWYDAVEQEYPDEPAEDTIKARHLPPGVVKIDDGRYILR